MIRRILYVLIPVIILFFYFTKNNLASELETVANKGNAEAQYHLGMIFNNGIGVKKDLKKALDWFEKSDANGDMLAAYKLGCYYCCVKDAPVTRDEEKGLLFKLKAADAGYALAQYDVGVVYYGKKDFLNAVKYFKLAADQGWPMAHYNLAALYKQGEGIKKDMGLAYAHFKLAKLITEKQINSKAQEGLDEIKKGISPDALKEAEEFVNLYRPQPTEITNRAKAPMDRVAAILKTSSQ